MRNLILLVAFALFSLEASAVCTKHSVVSFVSRFYEVGHHPSVPPSKPDLELSRHVFSARLLGALDAASEYRAKWIALHPSEPSPNGGPPVVYKPPFVDGDIFTGSPDGATVFEVSEPVRAAAEAWRVPVRSLPQPRMSPWSVVVVVVPEDGACAIDDVLYEGATKTSTATLFEFLSYRDEE